MNLNLMSVVMLSAGAVLVYAAVNNRDPRDVIRGALGQPPKYGSIDGIGDVLGKAAGDAAKKGAAVLPPPGGHGPIVSV